MQRCSDSWNEIIEFQSPQVFAQRENEGKWNAIEINPVTIGAPISFHPLTALVKSYLLTTFTDPKFAINIGILYQILLPEMTDAI